MNRRIHRLALPGTGRGQAIRPLRWQPGRAARWMLAALALAGCASQPLVGHYETPAASRCAALADHRFPVLPLAKEMQFSLTAQSPTLAFDGRPRHFAGFRVDEGATPSAVVVRSYLTMAYLPRATAVVPELHFYEGQLHPIGSVTAMDMWYHNEFWRVGVQGSVAVPRETRYIVLVAGNGDAGYGPMVRAENGLAYHIPAAALGDLSIRLVGGVGAGKAE
jgi:hypothetical protein